MNRLFCQYIAKESIIRTHKKPIASMYCNWAACAAHTGIDDTDIDRAWGKVAIARRQNPGARGDMLRCNIVRNVDGVSIRNYAKHNSFQHTDIAIAKAKIGHKGNN